MAKMYISNTWINDAAPAIDSTNLNNIEDGISVANRQDLSIVVTPPTDADYTLTATENQYGRIEVDTTNWTTARNIIMNNNEHAFLAVVNSNGSQDATFKTSVGTGIAVLAGEAKELRNDTVNVINFEAQAGISLAEAQSYDVGVNQTMTDLTGSRSSGVTYTNNTGKPIKIIVRLSLGGSTTATLTYDGNAISSFGNTTVGGVDFTFSELIEDGSTYSVSYSGTLISWRELR